MVTPCLYCGLRRTPSATETFSKKVHRHDIPFLTDLGLQGHQTWMAGSLDLNPKNVLYGIVQMIQIWASTMPDLLHKSSGGLGLVSGACAW